MQKKMTAEMITKHLKKERQKNCWIVWKKNFLVYEDRIKTYYTATPLILPGLYW